MVSQQTRTFLRRSSLLCASLTLIALVFLTAAPVANAQGAVAATVKGPTLTFLASGS